VHFEQEIENTEADSTLIPRIAGRWLSLLIASTERSQHFQAIRTQPNSDFSSRFMPFSSAPYRVSVRSD
jgi:hypothetical protein